MFNETHPPLALPPRRMSPPTHDVFQILEVDGETYDFHVGNFWAPDGSTLEYQFVTISGEFIARPRNSKVTYH